MSFFLYENSLSALTNVSVDGRGGGWGGVIGDKRMFCSGSIEVRT